MQIIPLSDAGKVSTSVTLNSRNLVLTTLYNVRARMWYVDVVLDGVTYFLGKAMVPEINLLRNNQELDTFGELRILDLNGDQNTTIDSLGNTAILLFFLPGEFSTLYPNFNKITPKPLGYDINEFFIPL